MVKCEYDQFGDIAEMVINEQPESTAGPIYNPISYVDDTLQHVDLNPSLPSSYGFLFPS